VPTVSNTVINLIFLAGTSEMLETSTRLYAVCCYNREDICFSSVFVGSIYLSVIKPVFLIALSYVVCS
jgi:hypothetical protein